MTNQSNQVQSTLRAALVTSLVVVALGLLTVLGFSKEAPGTAMTSVANSPVASETTLAAFETQVSERVKRLAARPQEAIRNVGAAQPELVRLVVNRFRVDSHSAHAIVATATTVANEQRLPVALILGVIARESSFDPRAVNDRDVGLMQVNLKWHADKIAEAGGPDAMFNPETNIRIGTQVLKEYIQAAGSVHGGLRRFNGLGKANNYPDEVLAFVRSFQSAV